MRRTSFIELRRACRRLPLWASPLPVVMVRTAAALRAMFFPMSGRRMGWLVSLFMAYTVLYIGFYGTRDPAVQGRLAGLNPFLFGIPAALLAYAFQLRLVHLKRLDVWMERLEILLPETRNLSKSLRDQFETTGKNLPLWWQTTCVPNTAAISHRVGLMLDTRVYVLGIRRMRQDALRALDSALLALHRGRSLPDDTAQRLDRLDAAVAADWAGFRVELFG